MKVSKNNYITREYTVVIEGGDIYQNLKIHLLGDINGDGKITTVDSAKANAHAKNKLLLSGYEFDCADINGDRAITTVDAARINGHAKQKTMLW